MFESGHQRVLGITRGQQLRGLLAFPLGISLDRSVGDDVERLRQALVRRGVGVGGKAFAGDEEQDKDDVDQGDRRLIEVVVVAGDELAQLVDEGAEARAADDRRKDAGPPPEKRQTRQERDQHTDAAEEHVGDVQTVAPDLRIAGETEPGADEEDSDHRRDEETLQEPRRLDTTRGIGMPRQRWRRDVEPHPASRSLSGRARLFPAVSPRTESSVSHQVVSNELSP